MKIGIDISQLAYSGTGVANYLENFINNLLRVDNENEYIFFFSSLRGSFDKTKIDFKLNPNISIRQYKIPPSVLNLIWNRFHVAPIEWFTGDLDVFITSDWTEPPAKKAMKATIIYDMVVYKYPDETHRKIISTQKRKLSWVKKESDVILTISESSKKDIKDILKIESDKIKVIYPSIYPIK